MLWVRTIGDSGAFGGRAWVGVASITAADTVRVELAPPESFFSTHPPVRKFSIHQYVTDPNLPEFGKFVYVEELPEVISRVPPRYPEVARTSGASGTVMVQALVGKDGHVKATRVASPASPFDMAAEESVRQWIFKPGLSHNKPTAVWIIIPVRFSP